MPAARAIIVWMVGEYNSLGDRIPQMLTSVLKYVARCFTSEASETKLQILNTATKVKQGLLLHGSSLIYCTKEPPLIAYLSVVKMLSFQK